jgi:hypothetical protein
MELGHFGEKVFGEEMVRAWIRIGARDDVLRDLLVQGLVEAVVLPTLAKKRED